MDDLQELLDSLNQELDYLHREKYDFDRDDNPTLYYYLTGRMAGMARAVLILERQIKMKKVRST